MSDVVALTFIAALATVITYWDITAVSRSPKPTPTTLLTTNDYGNIQQIEAWSTVKHPTSGKIIHGLAGRVSKFISYDDIIAQYDGQRAFVAYIFDNLGEIANMITEQEEVHRERYLAQFGEILLDMDVIVFGIGVQDVATFDLLEELYCGMRGKDIRRKVLKRLYATKDPAMKTRILTHFIASPEVKSPELEDNTYGLTGKMKSCSVDPSVDRDGFSGDREGFLDDTHQFFDQKTHDVEDEQKVQKKKNKARKSKKSKSRKKKPRRRPLKDSVPQRKSAAVKRRKRALIDALEETNDTQDRYDKKEETERAQPRPSYKGKEESDFSL